MPTTRGQSRRARALVVPAATEALGCIDTVAEILGWLNMDEVSRLKAVHSDWARAARRLLVSVMYLGRQPLGTLLRNWRPHRHWPCDAALLSRIATHPAEVALDVGATAEGSPARASSWSWLSEEYEMPPIHYALCALSCRPQSEDVIRALICAAPTMVSETDGRGRLPLHHAARNSFVSLEIAEELLRVHPDAANQKEKDCMNGGPAVVPNTYPADLAITCICSTTVDKYCTLVAAMTVDGRAEHAPYMAKLLTQQSPLMSCGAWGLLIDRLVYLSRPGDGLADIATALAKSVVDGCWREIDRDVRQLFTALTWAEACELFGKPKALEVFDSRQLGARGKLDETRLDLRLRCNASLQQYPELLEPMRKFVRGGRPSLPWDKA